MNKVIVDTNIVSFLFKSDTRAELYRPHLKGVVPSISFVTVAELHRWPIERNWGAAKINKLEEGLKLFEVLFPDEETCRLWATVATLKGHPIDYHDAWIGATALRHGITLISHNRKDFEHIPNLNLISL
ncbi:MAG: type II toxin-antitoxin system VapC family toxin [Planctomycetes bacterium]|nr:type II toxin-antitoxin system VapC family toxin [Planctomycetota bacterium]